MFIPLSDDNSARIRRPFVNIGLLIINIIVFFFIQQMGYNEHIIAAYATVPEEIISGTDVVTGGFAPSPAPVFLTILSGMFMHGGIMHILGNMLYLWIFGDNLENVMGPFKYLLFYITCGIIASLSHVYLTYFLGQNTLVPSLGASGAISGVLGGYLLLFPKNQVNVLFFRWIIPMLAFVTLGAWIVMQLVTAYNVADQEGMGGVAYGAHIGGFFAGILMVKFFATQSKVDIKS